MDQTTKSKRLAYCGCLYCGKIVSVNPEFCRYCNLRCEFATVDGPRISSEEWLKNYYDSLPAFEEKLKNWRFRTISEVKREREKK